MFYKWETQNLSCTFEFESCSLFYPVLCYCGVYQPHLVSNRDRWMWIVNAVSFNVSLKNELIKDMTSYSRTLYSTPAQADHTLTTPFLQVSSLRAGWLLLRTMWAGVDTLPGLLMAPPAEPGVMGTLTRLADYLLRVTLQGNTLCWYTTPPTDPSIFQVLYTLRGIHQQLVEARLRKEPEGCIRHHLQQGGLLLG